MPSGSSALSTVATAPFGQRRRWFDGSYCAPCATASNPDAPSIITARASLKVAPTSAMRRMRLARTPLATHSAPARVLPAPRPPRKSHKRQRPSGASCSSRALNFHSGRRSAATSSVIVSRNIRHTFGSNEPNQLAHKRCSRTFMAIVHLVHAQRRAARLELDYLLERAMQLRQQPCLALAAFERVFRRVLV